VPSQAAVLGRRGVSSDPLLAHRPFKYDAPLSWEASDLGCRWCPPLYPPLSPLSLGHDEDLSHPIAARVARRPSCRRRGDTLGESEPPPCPPSCPGVLLAPVWSGRVEGPGCLLSCSGAPLALFDRSGW
jgi:hypothetical protein